MKFVVGHHKAETPQSSVFVIQGDVAVDISSASPDIGQDLSSVIPLWMANPDAVRQLVGKGKQVPANEVVPALPIANPEKVVCLGLNFVEHAKEGGYDIPTYPALFLRVNTSLVASDSPIILPNASETLDYEAELMVVIGKGGRHIPEASALEHVFGYTTFNDGSIRTYQRKTPQWTAGKNFDQTGAIGPAVVTTDDLPAGADGLQIQTRLNGEVMQNSTTSDMIFSVANTVATVSEIMTLRPGDMIAFGTPPGVGHARKPPVWMANGDVVEVEIEGIGICRNPIVAEGALS